MLMSGSPVEQAYLAWTHSFSVGVPQLDEDHRALVRLINRACAAADAADPEQLLSALDDLVELANGHFEREEAIMHQLPGYALLPAHSAEHRNRIRQLEATRSAAAAEMRQGPKRLQEELVDWFVKQTVGHDAKIKAYFDSCGVNE
jgi:hemerythrin